MVALDKNLIINILKEKKGKERAIENLEKERNIL